MMISNQIKLMQFLLSQKMFQISQHLVGMIQ